MKKISYVIVVISLIGIIYINMTALKERVSKKAIIQQTLYSLTTKDEYLVVPIYINQKDAITEEKSLLSVYIYNENQTVKLRAESVTIEKGNPKKYLNETYQTYYYQIKLPTLNMDLYMKNCILEINLKNDKQYKFDIGRLSIFNFIDDSGIEILIQQGKNDVKEYQLSEIELDIRTSQPIEIEHIFYTVNHFVRLNEVIENRKEIRILIPLETYLYKETALKIMYNLGGVKYEKTLHLFRYFDIIKGDLDDEHLNRVYNLD